MKKYLALVALIALAGCSYDYYSGGIRYTQDGSDCIYSSDENAYRYSKGIDSADVNKEIVYRNTQCADLYARDMMKSNREPRHVSESKVERVDEMVVAPQYNVMKPKKKSCNCCKKAHASQQYVIISGM